MSTALLVTLAVSVGGVAAFVAFLVWLVRKVRQAKADALAELERDVLRGRRAARIDERASFLGVESRGATQMRGNGTIVLTDDEIAFVLWIPHLTIRIPLRDVLAVDTALSHLGKSLATPLLRVRWRTAGVEDTVAWRVSDVAGWVCDVQRASPSQPHA